MFKILIVEDNKDILELFSEVLTRNGFLTFHAMNGEEALSLLEREKVDLMIADLMMPKMDGNELVDVLRKTGETMPILIITARDDFESMNRIFSKGADDYMVKPINLNEMILRVNALLRRAKIHAEKKIQIGKTKLDYDSMVVTVDGKEIFLTLKEFQLLYLLCSYPNKIFTRNQLMDMVWGMDSESDDKTINTHINRLRDKFEECDDFEIVTIRGLGYKVVKK